MATPSWPGSARTTATPSTSRRAAAKEMMRDASVAQALDTGEREFPGVFSSAGARAGALNPARLAGLYAVFAISGFCGLIYESIWSHYLKLFLGHAAYAQTVVLIVFIGGLAGGAWLAGRFATRFSRPLLAYAAAELAIGLAALGFHRFFVGATDWAYASLLPAMCSGNAWCWPQWLFAGLIILPQSLLLGTTFPLMTTGILRLVPREAGSKLSYLYFLNSAGGVARRLAGGDILVSGVLASGYILVPAIGLPGALTSAGLVNIVLAMAVYFLDKGARAQAAAVP